MCGDCRDCASHAVHAGDARAPPVSGLPVPPYSGSLPQMALQAAAAAVIGQEPPSIKLLPRVLHPAACGGAHAPLAPVDALAVVRDVVAKRVPLAIAHLVSTPVGSRARMRSCVRMGECEGIQGRQPGDQTARRCSSSAHGDNRPVVDDDVGDGADACGHELPVRRGRCTPAAAAAGMGL